MKANELRIGNYVEAEGYINCPNFRVDEIRLTDRGYILRCYPLGDMQIYLDAPLDMVEPIRLTPGILEACGFERDGEYVWIHENPGGRVDVVNYDAPTDWNNTTGYPIEISGTGGQLCFLLGTDPHAGESVIRTLYLHDLQNKFYAITGKELDVKW